MKGYHYIQAVVIVEDKTVAILANSVTAKVNDLTSRQSTTVATTANSVSSSKVTYTATCRLKNMNFNAAMTDKTSLIYIETYKIVHTIVRLIHVYFCSFFTSDSAILMLLHRPVLRANLVCFES
jgi:hypothetical protein